MADIDYSQIIIRLIRADLNNVQIIKFLSPIFTNISNYKLNLYEEIFELMQLNTNENCEELRIWYFNQLKDTKFLPLNSLDKVAINIYDGLKMKCQGKS